MNISKELKNASFHWDEEKQMFTIIDSNGNQVELNKTYSFAFTRFFVRVAQRNWFRNKKSPNKTSSPESEQMIFFN